jgi:hypothetical protein
MRPAKLCSMDLYMEPKPYVIECVARKNQGCKGKSAFVLQFICQATAARPRGC